MNNWFQIGEIMNAGGKDSSADVYIFDYIGGWEITAKSFVAQVKRLDVKQINLHINSPGGYVFDGVAIQNVLKNHKANVTVYIDGLAASIASVIALAGDTVHIADNAYVMIHNPMSIVMGEAKDMLKEAELLDKITDGIAGDYSRKMGITVEEARALMDKETWYLGQEAVDAGFADSTYAGMKAAAAWGEHGRTRTDTDGHGGLEQKFDLKHVALKPPAAVIERFSRIGRVDDTSLATKTKETDMTKPKENQGVLETPKNAADPAVTEGQGAAVQEAVAEKPVDAVATPAEAAYTPADVQAAVQEGIRADRARARGITDLGEKFGFTASAKEFVDGGKSVEEFQAHILNKSPEDWKASLAVKNPSVQASEEVEKPVADADGSIEQIKAARAKRR